MRANLKIKTMKTTTIKTMKNSEKKVFRGTQNHSHTHGWCEEWQVQRNKLQAVTSSGCFDEEEMLERHGTESKVVWINHHGSTSTATIIAASIEEAKSLL